MELPAPLEPGSYHLALVCLGNICRSPMAHVVLDDLVADLPVTVSSAGTGDWHIGEPMDARAAATLTAAGLDPTAHRANQIATVEGYDVVLAMDDANLRDLGGRSERVLMFRDFDPSGPGEVPDPWFGGQDGFDVVLDMVVRTSKQLASQLEELLAG